jgi:predicted RNA-binding Zn-ribbon protein involved in translation (DUF1610 family)
MAGDQKYCPSCGTPNLKEVIFCTACGSKFPVFNTQAPAVNAPAASMPAAAAVNPVMPAIPQVPQTKHADFITLSCPNCGGRLQITADTERFACQYCGFEHIVRRSGGAVSLEPVVRMMGQINNSIGMVGSGVYRLSGSAERQASEAAIVRLKQEIDEIKKLIAQDNSNASNIWMLTLFFFLGGGFFMFMGYVTAGYVRVMEIIGKVLGWIILPISVILFFAAISTSGTIKKMVAQKEETLRKKEAELQQHYQVVSQAPRNY